MAERFWDGKDVYFVHEDNGRDRRDFQLGMTEQTARNLALALTKLRQTTMMLPESVGEIVHALNYVLVGDPASGAAHRRLNAGKGMEPAGGDPTNYGPQHPFREPVSPMLPKDKCVHSADGKAHTLCWLPRERHAQ
jgi:hypothetical protein